MLKLKSLADILTGHGKCDTEIRTRIGQVKETNEKLSNVLRNGKIPSRKKEKTAALQCDIHPFI